MGGADRVINVVQPPAPGQIWLNNVHVENLREEEIYTGAILVGFSSTYNKFDSGGVYLDESFGGEYIQPDSSYNYSIGEEEYMREYSSSPAYAMVYIPNNSMFQGVAGRIYGSSYQLMQKNAALNALYAPITEFDRGYDISLTFS